MASHIDTGKIGEEMAVEWLQQKGFEIIKRNWRSAKYEIDIIASMDDCIHFIEVKTRKTDSYGFPEEQVGKNKLRQFIDGGSEYMYQSGCWNRVRYDILAINITEYGTEYLFIEDVYL